MSPDVESRRGTVMLVCARDAAASTPFMLRRNFNSDSLGGAYVFQGGAVDRADRDADLKVICKGRTDAEATARARPLTRRRAGSPTGSPRSALEQRDEADAVAPIVGGLEDRDDVSVVRRTLVCGPLLPRGG